MKLDRFVLACAITFFLSLMALSACVRYERITECRRHGFSNFYCWGQG